MAQPAYRTAAMMRVSIARKMSIDSPFRWATGRSGLLGALAAALALTLSTPAGAFALELSPTVAGTKGDNDWYTSDVVVSWTFSGATTASPDCLPRQLTADTPGTAVTCTVSDNAGGSISRKVTVTLDRTPPTAVTAAPARPPDVSPFYTAPLPISWSATDATSGIATCTALTYAGPEGSAVAPTGTCRDRAGNVSAPLPFTFSYGMPPAPAPVIPTPPPAAGPGGPTATSTTAKPKAKRPTLTWRARSNVKYYNLQLFRNGRKILSAWPTVAHYTLKPSWRYRGHTYKLTAGRYRWYVWPGYGPRAAHRYGRLLSKGAVTVPTS
jgi:hypothetical protein